jgi:MarR family transcriptional regulator, organic hydroperoxide resistance regulator
MSPEEELRFLILGAQREGNRVYAALLSPHGITPSQAEALRCLQDAGDLSLGGLGERLVCEAGSPSRLVSSVVDKGWVQRAENPSDRRAVSLALTEVGRERANRVAEAEAQLHVWIASRLDADKIEAAANALRTLLEDSHAGNAVRTRRVGDGCSPPVNPNEQGE